MLIKTYKNFFEYVNINKHLKPSIKDDNHRHTTIDNESVSTTKPRK